MAFKFVALIALVAAVRAGVPYEARLAYASAPAVVAKTLDADYDPNPQYSYAYDVQDSLTGDYKQQQETRNGDFVQGSYSLLEADGTRRIVDYTADAENGFNAVIRKEEGSLRTAVAPASIIAAKIAPAAPLAIATPIAKIAPAYANIAGPALSYAAPIAHVSYSTPLFSYSH